MIKRVSSRESRQHRHRRVRLTLSGTEARPRVSVFRSCGHIYAQIIDDSRGMTLVQASSLDKETAGIEPAVAAPSEKPATPAPAETKGARDAKGSKVAKMETPAPLGKRMRQAQQVGTLLARRAVEKGIKQVVFDRGGYLYHGRIKALAESARAGGLEF